jgi:hypothetical protein
LIRTQAMERQPIHTQHMEASRILMPATGTLHRRAIRTQDTVQPRRSVRRERLTQPTALLPPVTRGTRAMPPVPRTQRTPMPDTALEQVHEPPSRTTRRTLVTLPRHRTSTDTPSTRVRTTEPPASLHL